LSRHHPLMQRFHPYQSYRAVATQTATPGQLILMLYEGAIRFLEQARLGFAQEDPLEFNRTINNNIQRAQAIIHELNETLNMQAGGQFAATMRSLYDYMDQRLHQSNQHKTEAGILDVLGRLASLRDAWAEMLRQQTVPSTGDTVLTLCAAA
jgi:flagellar secretion chaperone FliS